MIYSTSIQNLHDSLHEWRKHQESIAFVPTLPIILISLILAMHDYFTKQTSMAMGMEVVRIILEIK